MRAAYNDMEPTANQIPRTANYYIYVVGHPAAHYTLKVSVN
jgi:hypothetical protein